jgi:hypothetical protein
MKHGPCFAFSSDFLARSLVSFAFLSHVKRLRRHLGNLLFAGRQCQGFAAYCRQTKRSTREFAQALRRRRCLGEDLFWNLNRPAGRQFVDLSRRSSVEP